jgi:hypothetical protein
MVKSFCGIAKDTAVNKQWTKSRKYKVIAGKPVYLLLLDKKPKVPIGYTTLDPSTISIIPSFHYVTAYGSRISEEQVWFTHSMATIEDRTRIDITMARSHLH